MNSKIVAPPMEEDLNSDDFPKEWTVVTILDVCEVNPPKPSKDFLPADAPVTFVPMPAVDADMGAITNPQIKPYLEVRNGFTSFRNGDVIMAKITPCMENGKAALVHGMKNGIGFGSTEFHVMRSRGKILPEYLYYYIRQETFRNKAESHFTGSVGQKRVPADFIKQSDIPLPPLDEQKRIVARVEALLTNVNAARYNLSRVPLIMKKFRQAVLAAACSGRLSEGWRNGNSSTETSDQLIEQVTQELQKNTAKNKNKSVIELTQWNVPEPLELLEIPENWTWIAVKDTTSLMQYGISVKSDSDEKSGFPILRMGNIQEGSIDLTDLKFIPANTESISNFIVETGDILFNRTNSPELVGKSAVYKEKLQTVFASYLVRVRPNSNLILSDYLCWWINSMWGREWARNVRTDGVSQSNINAQKLSMMPVPLPPLAEQHEIVRHVGLLFERADAFDRGVAAAGLRCERLTQAVLGKAFRGELVEVSTVKTKSFTISDEEIKKAVFLKERYRTIFFPDQLTEKDLQDLKKIPSNDCTYKTKDLFTLILLKYSKLYGKNFKEPLDQLRIFEENNKDPKHRDHICHLFRVWGMGQILYKKGFSGYILKFKVDETKEESEANFDFVWCLATLYHDIGYATRAAGEDHGECGAKLLLNCLEEFKRSTSQDWTPHAMLAVDAIRLHNLEDTVDIIKDPWSALLIICDELQEFGRNIPLPGKNIRAEIQDMDVCLNLTATSPTMHVEMRYPKNQLTSRNDIDAEISDKKIKLNKLFKKRIHNLSINVECSLM